MGEKGEGLHIKEWAKEAVYKGGPEAIRENRVAITFDDGPTRLTRDLLEILNNRKVKATFFWFADEAKRMAEEKPLIWNDIMILINEGGHEIGLHGDYRQEGNMAEDKATLEALTGQNIALFRPHGWQLGEAIGTAKKLGLQTVLFTLRRGVRAEADSVNQVWDLSAARAGNILDIHEPNRKTTGKYTDPRKIVQALVSNLKQKDLKPTTITEVLK